jgi:hypothetical protein
MSIGRRSGDRRSDQHDDEEQMPDRHIGAAAASHRHDYMLATEVEVLGYEEAMRALQVWLASFEQKAIKARLHIPLVWHRL